MEVLKYKEFVNGPDKGIDLEEVRVFAEEKSYKVTGVTGHGYYGPGQRASIIVWYYEEENDNQS